MSFSFTTLIGFIAMIVYLTYRLLRGKEASRLTRCVILTVAGASSTLYALLYAWRYSMPDGVVDYGTLYSMMALIFLVYAVIIYSTFDAVLWAGIRLKLLPQKAREWARNHRIKISLLSSIAIIVVLYFGYLHAYDIQIVRHAVDLRKAEGEGRTITAAMVSDLHIGANMHRHQVASVVDLINSHHPDVIFVVGDMIDHDLYIAKREKIEEELLRLEAPLGTYAVLGNHEYRGWVEPKIRWLGETGMTLLRDSVVVVDSLFTLVGHDDYVNSYYRKSISELTKQIDHTRPLIVLEHQPVNPNEMLMNGVDLALYGHTHAGQIWPHTWLVQAVSPIFYGRHKRGPTTHIVSSGIGTAGPPLRIGSQSELVLLDLQID